jgi:hypothetical protein
MSHTFLFFGGPEPPPAEMQGDWQPPSMGSPVSVRATLDRLLPGISWFSDGWGQGGDETCLLAIFPVDEDPVVCVSMNLRGSMDELKRVARETGWHLIDGSSMELIDVGEP